MSEFRPSAALLRTRLVARPFYERDRKFENGEGTRPATQAHQRQAASLAAARVVKQTSRRRPTTEQRQRDVERRRTWAGGGNMPPNVRALYSEAERAALSVIAAQCKRKGFCDLCLDEIARLAGVGRTSVQNAIRKARANERSHISVRERPQENGKNLPNVIRIVCGAWLGWIGRAIGFKGLSTSKTGDKNSLSKGAETAKMAFERECVAAARTTNETAPSVEKHSSIWSSASRWTHGLGGAAWAG